METMYTSTPLYGMKTNNRQAAFRLVSYLLQYPDEEWWQVDDFCEAAEEIESSVVKEQISRFLAEMKERSLDELGESYVNTFDFNAKTSLYLTYSELREERERGQILLQLKTVYEAAGWELDSTELPDYLPIFLEFVSLISENQAQALWLQYGSAIERLADELKKIHSPYGWLIDACLTAIRDPIAPTEIRAHADADWSVTTGSPVRTDQAATIGSSETTDSPVRTCSSVKTDAPSAEGLQGSI